ncbi:hypothetical protein [Cognatiyoonia sp. IB215182]|uniref:hypothetical protein n=1 Tax=Cognatiyoonia sp. IB215182 TaxID=3097353 RepID=UPI002A12F402|nr:hypothetical protein [Cognatiyoonia sp. IB215182]MDX8351995.1 hypothetical protein [Cognatiyoonia sp. IB215182]
MNVFGHLANSTLIRFFVVVPFIFSSCGRTEDMPTWEPATQAQMDAHRQSARFQNILVLSCVFTRILGEGEPNIQLPFEVWIHNEAGPGDEELLAEWGGGDAMDDYTRARTHYGEVFTSGNGPPGAPPRSVIVVNNDLTATLRYRSGDYDLTDGRLVLVGMTDQTYSGTCEYGAAA